MDGPCVIDAACEVRAGANLKNAPFPNADVRFLVFTIKIPKIGHNDVDT
jgi:hypothetical protein